MRSTELYMNFVLGSVEFCISRNHSYWAFEGGLYVQKIDLLIFFCFV